MRPDDSWFEGIFAAHATAIFRYFRRRLPYAAGGIGHDADDLTAEVFTIAWRRRDSVPTSAELPWLYKTAGFVLANHVRKARAIPVAAVPDRPDDVDPATVAIADDQVRRVLAALSPRDRRILLLNAWDGLVGQDLADVLEISRGGADAALSRARARLREVWAQQEAPEETVAER